MTNDSVSRDIKRCTHRFESTQMHVNRSTTEVVTTGQGNINLSASTEQWPDQIDRGSNAISQFKGSDRGDGTTIHNLNVLTHLASGCRMERNAQPNSSEKVRHDVHIDNGRGIRQEVATVGKQRGGHQFQY